MAVVRHISVDIAIFHLGDVVEVVLSDGPYAEQPQPLHDCAALGDPPEAEDACPLEGVRQATGSSETRWNCGAVLAGSPQDSTWAVPSPWRS